MPRHPFLTAALTVALLPASASASTGGCPAGNARPGAASPLVLEHATLCLVNAERAARRLRPLEPDGRLRTISLRHSRDMVERHYFDHRGPGGPDFIADMIRLYRHGARFHVGENIAWGESYAGSPRSIVSAWMQSPPHRQNILATRYTRIGIGIARGVPHRRGLAGATYSTGFGS
jgi:uncharacterized protein YkwD